MRIITVLLGLMLLTTGASAQDKFKVTGKITDASNGEELIQATVQAIAGGKVVSGTATDPSGYYTIELPKGTYILRVTFIGFQQVEKTIVLESSTKIDFQLKVDENVVEEVVVTADVAKPRETPVAYTNVNQKKLSEELGSRDLPMVLNTTPGVYATQQGGGAGDARVTIRGFNQRNIAVMVDGIPVNDMENGAVFWSNWFGLGDVTRTMQVQRGLGVSKIANPAVGGTINIITKGIDARPAYSFSTETGNNGYFKASLSGTSGKLKGDFGLTYALTWRRSDGYVDALYDNMYAYFIKLDKKLGKHILTFAAMGAPQSHGQRSFRARLSVYDTAYAQDQGIDTSVAGTPRGKGRQYNQHWGYLARNVINDPDGVAASGDEDTTFVKSRRLNERENYYHKPQLYLKDYWTINKKFLLSSILYASFGNGGGTAAVGVPQDKKTGQFNFQDVYYNNSHGSAFFSPIDPSYSATERKSTGILYANVNNHRWFGILSTANYQYNSNLNLSGGIDLRYYKGIHYRTVYDLLGGDYFINMVDKNQTTPMKRVGDRMEFNYEGNVKWGGAFVEAEYKKGRYSTFLSLTSTMSAYSRTDFFLKKDSITGEYNTTPTKTFPGYTVKTGLNYNLTEHYNIYGNAGFLSRPPRFNNVFDRNNKPIAEVKNELVTSLELGLGYKSKTFSSNLNAYYTNWKNKPAEFFPIFTDVEGNSYSYNINGMKAIHKGIEMDFIYKVLPSLDIEGALGLADWRWKSGDTVRITDDAGNTLPGGEFFFSAQDVHVGDAAQTQATIQLRWEPIRRLYIKPSFTYFGRNYADFDPSALKGEFANRDSWKLPDYSLLNIHAGYGKKFKKVDILLTASVFNVLNTFYVSDAQHRRATGFSDADTFNPRNVEVFVGPGTTWNAGLKFIF